MRRVLYKRMCFLMMIVVITGCVGGRRDNNTSSSDEDTIALVQEELVEIAEENAYSAGADAAPGLSDAERRYRAMYDEIYRNLDIHQMRADGRRIWYNPWTPENESGYDNKLYVYDSETDRKTVVNLNRTSLEDDQMWVEDMVEHDGIITIIMSERRNSNGWVDGTYVWQYDCYDNSWKALARECSDAEFVNDRRAVRINNAEILNPEDPTALQEYRNHFRTVPL